MLDEILLITPRILTMRKPHNTVAIDQHRQWDIRNLVWLTGGLGTVKHVQNTSTVRRGKGRCLGAVVIEADADDNETRRPIRVVQPRDLLKLRLAASAPAGPEAEQDYVAAMIGQADVPSSQTAQREVRRRLADQRRTARRRLRPGDSTTG